MPWSSTCLNYMKSLCLPASWLTSNKMVYYKNFFLSSTALLELLHTYTIQMLVNHTYNHQINVFFSHFFLQFFLGTSLQLFFTSTNHKFAAGKWPTIPRHRSSDWVGESNVTNVDELGLGKFCRVSLKKRFPVV